MTVLSDYGTAGRRFERKRLVPGVVARAATGAVAGAGEEPSDGVELPFDGAVPEARLAWREVALDLEAVADLDRLTARCDLRDVLVAVATAVLSRYAGEAEVVLGVGGPAAGEAVEWRRLAIPFDPDETMAARMERVGDLLQRAPARTVARNRPVPGGTGAVVVSGGVPVPDDARIALVLDDGNRRVSLRVRTDPVEGDVAERVAGHLLCGLAHAARDPSVGAGAFDWLADEERRWLDEVAGRSVPPPEAGLLHEPFFSRAALLPGRTAVVAPDRTLTYAELSREALALAGELASRGVVPGMQVGVCLNRSSHLIVALMGVLAAGAAYVPLDPAYPPERLDYMLRDATCALVIAEAATLPVVAGRDVAVLDVAQVRTGPDAVRPAPVSADDRAYIIYTSGSTGQPKGVAIGHASAHRFVRWCAGTFSPAELSGVLAATSVCFDISVFEIFAPLCLGGTIHLVENVLAFADYERADQVRLVNTVPSAMLALAELMPLPPTVTTVNLAGEPLPGHLARQLHAARPGLRLLNLYGPTEDTIYSTWAEIPADLDGEPSIGRPLPGTTAYVLDARGRLVPPGVAGELHLGGAGLAHGYFGRPDLTAERFLVGGTADVPGERLYRTGDRVRLRRDGSFQHLGRLDDQVKLRGYRIELGEVTSALAELPGVAEAVAAIRPDGRGGQILVGYLVGDAAADDETLLRGLRARLPAFMVPGILMRLDALPKTLNGKVDRKLLPAPPTAASAGADGSAPDAVEAAVRDAWVEIVGAPPVSGTSSLLAAGGTSIHLVRLAARLRERIAPALRLRDVLAAPTPDGLAAAIRRLAGPERPQDADLSAHPQDAGPPAPGDELGPAQKRMWFLQQMDPADTSYLLAARLDVDGAPVEAVARAMRQLVDRHEALRTSIGDGAVAIRRRAEDVPIVTVAPDTGEHAPFSAGLVSAALARPMDLAAETPSRIWVAATRTGAAVLLVVHHVAFDDWSLGLIARDLVRLLEGDTLAPPPAGTVVVDGQEPEAAERFGRILAETAAARPFRPDLPGAARRSNAGAVLEMPIPADLDAAIGRVAKELAVSRVAVMMTAFASVLGAEAGLDRFVVATALAGRESLAEEERVGCFVNTLPVVVEPRPGATFRALAGEIGARLFDVLAHQTLPIERILRHARVQGALLAAEGPFSVAFGAHNARTDRVAGNGVEVRARFLETGKARLDLTLWIEDRSEGPVAVWTYATDLFTREGVMRRHAAFEALLDRAGRDPDHVPRDAAVPS
jgi:amino acid adenylation domain-containing protein